MNQGQRSIIQPLHERKRNEEEEGYQVYDCGGETHGFGATNEEYRNTYKDGKTRSSCKYAYDGLGI
jgi:hypothetical protein